jgi:trehalose 6-phosphate phosphatase
MHDAFAAFRDTHPGALVEDKGYAVALHYRQAPALAPAAAALAEAALAEAGDAVVLMRGDMVIEAKGRAADKGAAVRAFMAEAPFRGRTPVFVGDDVTDEDGFAAVDDMGGFAVIVGDRRPTAARWRLGSVAAVHDWLTALAGRTAA